MALAAPNQQARLRIRVCVFVQLSIAGGRSFNFGTRPFENEMGVADYECAAAAAPRPAVRQARRASRGCANTLCPRRLAAIAVHVTRSWHIRCA
jgi:hypothetical protein